MQHIAVVMPAYNEARGLPGFLGEVHTALIPLASTLSIVVVDDCSTDDTARVLVDVAERMPQLTSITAAVNRGHGPTALAAYRAGLETGAEVLLHIDGDGQFVGDDLPRVIEALGDDNDVVHGVRAGRTDPWYRKALTSLVGLGVAVLARHRVPDVNTPLRLYRRAAIERLLAVCPEDALVPHVHFSLNERRLGLRVGTVRVRSIPRRGGAESGTMWGEAARTPKLPPRRLLRFAKAAAGEVWRVDVRRRS